MRAARGRLRALDPPGRLLVRASTGIQSYRKCEGMKIKRVIVAACLSGFVLVGAGCGNPDQSDGQLLTPTEEVLQSRAAVEKAVKEQPNLYGQPKGGQERRR